MGDTHIRLLGRLWFCAVMLLAGLIVPAVGGDSADLLTAAQRQWLDNHPSLRIGVTVIPPQIIYDSKKGICDGLVVETIRAIESHLGYRFSLVYYATWDGMMKAADAGEIDIIFAAQKTPVRETKFVFTEPYLFMQNIIIADSDSEDIFSLDDLAGKRVAVVKGSSLEEDLGRLHPQINLIAAPDELTGLLRVSIGEEEAMVVEIARASYYIHDRKITNLRVVGDAKLPFSLGFACRKEMAEIRDILNAGLAAISPSQRAALQDKWIHLPRGGIGWRTLLGWFGLTAGVLSAALVWNLTLRSQVRKHRQELEQRFAEKEQMQQNLARFESQFRMTIDACPLGVHIHTLKPDGNLYFTSYNPAADKILHIDHRGLVGKQMIEAFPNLKETYIPDLYTEICQTGRSWGDDKLFYDDGRIQGYFEIRAFQIAPGQMAVMFSEISDRIKSQQALAESKRQLSTLMGNLPGVAYRCKNEPDWPFEFVNKGVQELTGYTDDEILSGTPNWNQIIIPEDRQKVWDEVQKAVAAKQSYHIEYQIVTRSGEIKVVWEQGCGIFDDAGNVVALEGLVLDITDRKREEKVREKLMKEIQAKNEELQSIVFISSHDLRSPLINIQGFSGELQKACRELTVLLGREPLRPDSQPHIRRLLDEDIPEALSFIGAGANKMDVLLKGLLNLSRVGSATIHSEPVDMNRLLASVVKTVAYQTRESDIHLDIGSLPPCLGDAMLLNQIFTNLIDNAIKYRRSDCQTHIMVSGQRIDGRVRYRVADNGIGISAEHTGKIFEIFHRLNPSGSIKGEGLGLTIVRRILDRLDGEISVESIPGQGSCFMVELPAAQQKAKTV